MITRKPSATPPTPGEIKPAQPSMQLPLGYDPAGQMEPVDITSTKEGWSEYNLDDGSVIRAKAVLLDVKRAVGQYDPDGNPIYLMQFAFVNRLKVPGSMKKPASVKKRG